MSEAWKLRVEYNEEGTFKYIRPHRQFFGREQAKIKAHPVELEFEEDEDIFGAFVDDSEVLQGRSAKVQEIPGLVLTSDPHLYGPEAARQLAGKPVFQKLEFGCWNLMNTF
jgi:hypothetical protein